MKKFDLNNDSLNYDFAYNPEETKKLQSIMQNKKDISVEDLRRISLWKLDRVLDVSEETITSLQQISTKTELKLESNLVYETFTLLTNSNGIGFPMASAILKFIRPDIFPIIDVRAYRAIYGKKLYSTQYTVEKYLDYVKRIYEISKALNIEVYKVDEQLYCFDKEHNGKI